MWSGMTSTVLAVGMLVAQGLPARAAGEPESCPPVAGMQSLCGPVNAEDFAPVPGSSLIVASGMVYPQGALYVLEPDAGRWRSIAPGEIRVAPDRRLFPGCAPPDFSTLVPHGLELGRFGGRQTLFVVNHGGRESIEAFEIAASGASLALTWRGCILAPEGTSPNALALLPDGGLAVSNMMNPRLPQAQEAYVHGKLTGNVLLWRPPGHPRAGWLDMPDSVMSGPNGIAASPDGRWLYVNDWGRSQLVRLSRANPAEQPLRVDLPFHPDNTRWAPDGTLLVAGQYVDLAQLGECLKTLCAQPFGVVRVDPATMRVEPLMRFHDVQFGSGTVALQVGSELWIGSYAARRIGRFPLAASASR